MKRPALLLLPLALWFAGCDRNVGAENGKNEQASKTAELPAGTIRLSADAQTLAGITVIEVQHRTLPETLNAAGQISMNEEKTVHVGSYTPGRIVDVRAMVGDPVKRGAVLARMHSHEVHDTIAAYETAKQEVTRQRNALDLGARTRDRMKRLYALKSASLSEVERAETEYRSLESSLANAQISVQREVAHLSDILRLPASRLDHIDERLELIPFVSPIPGIVIARMISPGFAIEPGQETFTISDLTSVWMIAAVNEPDIAKLQLGQHAQVTLPSFADRQFPATVTRINSELDIKTRTLPVRLLLPNPGQQLRVAMYANAQIQQASSRTATFLPEEAIQDLNGGPVVFVRKSTDLFEVRPVQIARRMNGEVEISSGLSPGDAVVVKGSFVAKSEMLKSQIGE